MKRRCGRTNIANYSVARYGPVGWRVLYKGNDWINDFTDTLPQWEWCPTKRWAIRKARGLAREAIPVEAIPVQPSDEAMRVPTTDLRRADGP